MQSISKILEKKAWDRNVITVAPLHQASKGILALSNFGSYYNQD